MAPPSVKAIRSSSKAGCGSARTARPGAHAPVTDEAIHRLVEVRAGRRMAQPSWWHGALEEAAQIARIPCPAPPATV
ncbi:hypothetical protein [Streptomyces sp. NPDC055013]